MNSGENAVLVAGVDVAMDRFEGEVLLLDGAGNWRRVGFGILHTGVLNSSHQCLAQGIETVEAPTSTRPWLRQKKGRAAA
jgi:hypothetical protein